MADECSNCAGGQTLVVRINPDPAVVDVVTNGNIVLIPQRLDPARVGIDQLAGVLPIDVAGLVDGKDYVWRWSDTRVFDVDGNVVSGGCGFDVSEPADCMETVWNPGDTAGPAVVGDEMPGAVAVNEATGCVSHLFCNGRWVCIGGTGTDTGPAGPGDERVCYPDLSGQTYSAGCGEWIIFGSDVMSPFVCGDERVTACATGLETSTGYGAYSGNGPAAGWGSIVWDTNYLEGTVLDGCDTILNTQSSGDPRREFRVDFGVPSGSGCPLKLSFEIVSSSGTIGMAGWDSVSNTTLPVTIISAPSSASVQSGPTGPVVKDPAGNPGTYILQFDCTAGVDPANVRIVFFNWGGSTMETAETLTLEYTQSAAPGCFSWPTINAQADWLNSVDSNGGGWLVDGNQICKTVGPGQGAAYGNLAGCDSGSTPTIEEL